MTRNDFIKKIHVLKRDLSLDDDTYRLVLYNVTEKTSCCHLDEERLNLVYLAFKKMLDNVGRTSSSTKNPNQHRFIARLMDHLKWSWVDTASFCERIVGKKSTKACNPSELSKLIRALIGVIDFKLDHGEITMTHTEKFNYLQHTKHVRRSHDDLCDAGEHHRQQSPEVTQ
jgi:phage gp16-like protein